MYLYHTTTRRSLASIYEKGICPLFANSDFKACWFHSESRSCWAALHVCKRHKCKLEDVVRIKVWVPRSWLRRAKSGLWYSRTTLGAGHFKSTCGWGTLAESPLEGLACVKVVS